MKTPKNHPAAYDKYAYIIKNAHAVRFVYALGIVTWFSVLYGYARFFSLDRRYWLIFGPIVLLFTLYHLISYGLNLFYRAFDVRKHDAAVKKFWANTKNDPSVDVFLPICGEDPAILETTFAAVRAIDYGKKKVYVLDDGASAEAKALAARFGFEYLSRPNRGEMKKAGNLKYGHEHSNGEFIVVFDADFAPRRDFVRELLPYMQDQKTAIVQSPQYFIADSDTHRRSPLEFGAGQTQEDFYRIIQVSRDRFGGAICVGSNAIYRRSALNAIGGTAQIEHSEDVHTGFNLIAAGYAIKYVPLILAVGLCPSELDAYFHQQHRWCSGSMSMLLSKKFWTTKLGFARRLCFWSGFLYYITHALALLMAFQVFVILFRHFDQISLANALPFFPYFVYSFIVLPIFRRTAPKYGSMLVRMAHSYSYSHAVVSNLFRQHVGWRPTNSKSNGVSRPFAALLGFNAAYVLTYVALVSYAAASGRLPLGNIRYYSVLFWVFYFLITNGIFLWHSFSTMAKMRPDRGWRFRAGGAFAAMVIAVVTIGVASASLTKPVVPAAIASAPAVVVSAPALPLTYAATATPGDSLTTLYREMISMYLADAGRDLDGARHIYAEDGLVKDHDEPVVQIGETVTAQTSEIERWVDASERLDAQQVTNLAQYAALVVNF